MKEVYVYLKALTIAMVLALGFAQVAGHAQTSSPPPPLISGMVGLASGQTARINAVNISKVPIRLALSFLTGDGSVFKRVEGTLQPGHSAFLDATRAEAGRGDGRVEIYADVILLPAVQTAFPPDPCIPTLEIFGADGKTTVLDTDFHNPPGD